jgi:hypothetical protein
LRSTDSVTPGLEPCRHVSFRRTGAFGVLRADFRTYQR